MPCWLLKAEPETRIEKGKDVKFSVDDFEECKVTQWEGVRNHEAKNMMKEQMKVGDKALFYASNCKVPGVTALAKVIKEGYPDWSAWDPAHPYYDPKTVESNPTWFMVDLEFVSRLPHAVPLKLLQLLATLPEPPACTPYLTPEHLAAVKGMFLLNRGRLSVQPVGEEAFEAVRRLGEEGGWEGLLVGAGAGAKGKGKAVKVVKEEGEVQSVAGKEEGGMKVEEGGVAGVAGVARGEGKRKAAGVKKEEELGPAEGRRRSKRNKKEE